MVRPFYIEANITGRQTNVSGGPRRSDGSINTNIYQRDEGDITTPFTINQFSSHKDGKLILITNVYYQGELLKQHITNY